MSLNISVITKSLINQGFIVQWNKRNIVWHLYTSFHEFKTWCAIFLHEGQIFGWLNACLVFNILKSNACVLTFFWCHDMTLCLCGPLSDQIKDVSCSSITFFKHPDPPEHKHTLTAHKQTESSPPYILVHCSRFLQPVHYVRGDTVLFFKGKCLKVGPILFFIFYI